MGFVCLEEGEPFTKQSRQNSTGNGAELTVWSRGGEAQG